MIPYEEPNYTIFDNLSDEIVDEGLKRVQYAFNHSMQLNKGNIFGKSTGDILKGVKK